MVTSLGEFVSVYFPFVKTNDDYRGCSDPYKS
jgi:hypothetical protein